MHDVARESEHGTIGVHPQGHERAHPTPAKYVTVAAILSIITLVEVGIYYTPALRPILPPVFLILSATKFATVVMFYMHLRFDHRLFSTFFVAGLLLAALVLIALLALFRNL